MTYLTSFPSSALLLKTKYATSFRFARGVAIFSCSLQAPSCGSIYQNRYYVTFTKITRPRIKIEAPDLPRGELNRELGRRWRELSDEAKRKWVPSLLEENNDSGGTAAVDASSSSLLGAAAAAELHLGESDEDDDDEGDDDDGNLPGDLALPASMVETSVVEM